MSLPFRVSRAPLAAVALLAACAHDPTTGPGTTVARRPLTAAEGQAVRASNIFALDLLREVGGDRAYAAGNVVLSPYSGSSALVMTTNGAAGATRTGMLRALGLDGQTMDGVNGAYQTLTAFLLGADRGVTVQSANSVWAAEGFTLRPAFAEVVRRVFDGEARTVRFGTVEATRAINAWASDRTAGRIPRVFDDGNPTDDYVLVLMNALYFKGSWTARFDAARTAARPFTLTNGTTVSVPTMLRDDTPLRVGADGATQLAELAYGSGAYAMTIVLPPRGTDLVAHAAALTPARWEAMIGSLRDASLPVQLPKFTLRGETFWNDALVRLGMDAAFDPSRADFSGLSEQCVPGGPAGGDCHIGFVKQNVFLQVDEDGTVAAAVTSIGVAVRSAPVAFTVDRPFLFAIRERASGAILFIGRVVDPRG